MELNGIMDCFDKNTKYDLTKYLYLLNFFFDFHITDTVEHMDYVISFLFWNIR